tara:strand:- start:237 stop:1181 length:945 start_codon:yes stop_codon:yes gene_type:complete
MNSKFSSYIMAPSQSEKSLHGNKYNINSLGLRDEEIDSPYGEILALAVGDSSTMGYGVKVEERFSNVLSRTISKQPLLIKKIDCSDCDSMRILNAGHSGYSAIDTLGMTNYLLNLGIKPRILIVGVANDDFGKPLEVTVRGKYGTKVARTNNPVFIMIEVYVKDILRNSATYQFVANSLKNVNRNMSFQQSKTSKLKKLNTTQTIQLNAFLDLLSKSKEASDNIPVIFVYLPKYWDLEDVDSYRLTINMLKKKVALSNCAVFIDPRKKLISSDYDRMDLYALNDPHHPSALGHKVISEAINEEIPNLLDACALK